VADVPGPTEPLAELFRRESGRALASVMAVVRDLDLAEEILQDALTTALERWPRERPLNNPGAWLTTLARHRAIDVLRRRKHAEAALPRLAAESPSESAAPGEPEEIPDERLRLIFTCCHPALSEESQVALTLRLLGGLTVPEIARAFLTREATIAQRLVRAKRVLQERQIPYEVPAPEELPERLSAVLTVLYLVFNEGYTARAGKELVRTDLSAEACRLAEALAGLLPQPEVLGLLALLELTAAREATRIDAEGNLVVLAEQDRARWDRPRIDRALAVLDRALRQRQPGPFQVQAAIAACHAEAQSWEATDWPQIAALYEALEKFAPSPVVALNHAVAIGMAQGAAEGLRRLDALAELPALESYHLLPAARADFLRQLGRFDEAREAYAQAEALALNERERAFLRRRIDECTRS
jgi:RNA polymerase sigma-70 factor (ECF subfamily)